MAKMKFNIFKFIRSMIVISAILFCLIQVVFIFLSGDAKYYSADYDELTIEKKLSAYVFRNEKIVIGSTEGTIKYFVTEGERIKKGQKIGEIYIDAEGSNSAAEVAENSVGKVSANAESVAEETVVDPSQILSRSYESIQMEADYLRIEIVEKINSMELDEVSELKSELERNLRLLSDFSERQKKVASVASTNSAITQSNNVINGETIQLFSPSSGIITFNVDQYEEIFTVGNIYNIDFDSIAHNSFEIENIKTNRITFGDRIYKVVDNSNWYAVTMIEQEDVHYYDENQMVKVKIGDKTVDGEISSIFPLNNKIVIAIKINDAVKDFYKERILEIGLLQDNYKGLKVYKSSIVKYNDIEGVFTINNLDKAEFKPVQVIAYDEEFAVIKGNYFYKMLNGDKERVNTVELFDKVLLEGEKYSEGDLID